MKTVRIAWPHAEIAALCAKFRVVELAVFGSVLRADFRDDSDVDVLIVFAPEAGASLFDQIAFADALSALCGRKVDVHTRRGVERSRNALIRQEILSTAQVMHAA